MRVSGVGRDIDGPAWRNATDRREHRGPSPGREIPSAWSEDLSRELRPEHDPRPVGRGFVAPTSS